MDYLVVGSGLFGAVFAHEAAKRGNKVTVIEQRNHLAGNIYTKEVDGIQVHQYGAHIVQPCQYLVADVYLGRGKNDAACRSPVCDDCVTFLRSNLLDGVVDGILQGTHQFFLQLGQLSARPEIVAAQFGDSKETHSFPSA